MADLRLDFVGPGARLALAAAKAAQSAFKNLLGQGTSILAQGNAYVYAAEIAAARAEAAELVLEVTTAGGWFDSETDPELLALPNGTGAFINTNAGDFYTVEMVDGAPVRRTTFLTRYSDRHNGINLWEYAKGDRRYFTVAATSGSASVSSPADTFTAADVGKLILVPGAGASGGPLATTIQTVTDARHVVMAASASTTVSGQNGYFGTDDTAAINLAHALAAGLGITRVNYGSSSQAYLLGGPFVTLGTFTTPSGAPVPFNRHKIRLYANMHLVGSGATVQLMGGSTYPGGIFGHPWWDGERLPNVKVLGITMDGDWLNQIVPPIPANSGGGGGSSVWQHGNAITGCFDGLEVAHCVFRRLYGHGINFNWASANPDAWAAPQHIDVHHNEFVDVFTQACNAGAFDTHFHHNTIHGDGFWVGGFDIESGDPNFPIRNVRSHDNTYDYRDGLCPSVCVSQFASDSAEAMAARRHLRRAVTSYCPGDAYTGTMRDVVVRDEIAYQGTFSLNRFGATKAHNLRVRNEIVEVLPDGYNASAVHAIGMLGFGWKVPDCSITEPDVVSFIKDGLGAYVDNAENFILKDASFRGMPTAAVRLQGVSGVIDGVRARDFGDDDSDLPDDQIGVSSSAVVVFGGQADMLDIRNVRATDTRSGSARRVRHAVYANVGATPLTSIEFCKTQNAIGVVVRDVNGLAFKVGNTASESATFSVSSAMTVAGNLDVNGGTLGITSVSGAASLAINAAASQQAKIVWSTGGSLEYTNTLEPNGQVNFTTYNNGTVVANPFAIANDGHLVILNDWTYPMQVAGIGYRWMAAGQIERVKGSAPTSDTDGTVVGAQS